MWISTCINVATNVDVQRFYVCVCTQILILKDGGSHYAANVGRIPTRVTTWESKVYETIVGICVQNVISLCDHIVYFSTFGHIEEGILKNLSLLKLTYLRVYLKLYLIY